MSSIAANSMMYDHRISYASTDQELKKPLGYHLQRIAI